MLPCQPRSAWTLGQPPTPRRARPLAGRQTTSGFGRKATRTTPAPGGAHLSDGVAARHGFGRIRDIASLRNSDFLRDVPDLGGVWGTGRRGSVIARVVSARHAAASSFCFFVWPHPNQTRDTGLRSDARTSVKAMVELGRSCGGLRCGRTPEDHEPPPEITDAGQAFRPDPKSL